MTRIERTDGKERPDLTIDAVVGPGELVERVFVPQRAFRLDKLTLGANSRSSFRVESIRLRNQEQLLFPTVLDIIASGLHRMAFPVLAPGDELVVRFRNTSTKTRRLSLRIDGEEVVSDE